MRGTSDSLHKGRGPSPTPDQLPELCAGPPASRVPPVPTAQPSLAPNPERGGVQSRGQGSAIYLELRGQEEAANRSRQGRARPGGVKRLRGPGPRGDGEAVAAGGGGGVQGPPPPSAGPEPRPPLTLLLLQGQLVLVVAVEVAPEEEGEFGVLLLLLHRHLLELGPVPRHELRQLVDDIPQLLVCGEAAPSARAGPAPSLHTPPKPPFLPLAPLRPPPGPRSPSGGSGISMAAGQRGRRRRR